MKSYSVCLILAISLCSASFLRQTQETTASSQISSIATSSSTPVSIIDNSQSAQVTSSSKSEVTDAKASDSTSAIQPIVNETVKVDVSKETPENKTQVADAFCFINNNGVVYDLNTLKSDIDYKVETLSGFINFNFCRDQVNPCKDQTGSASFTSSKLGTECIQIAGSNTVSSKIFIQEEKKTNDKNEEVVSTLIRLDLPEGEICKSDANKKYQTIVELKCDESQEVPIFTNNVFDSKICENKIYGVSKAACPKYDVYGLWNSILNNKYIFGSILILLGAFFCFVGENFLKITQVIAGAALTLILVLYFIFNFTSIIMGTWVFWLVIVLAFALGGLVGYFMSKISWLPGLVFGFLLGFVLGFVVFNIALKFIASNSIIVFWTSMVICIILGCLLGYYKEEEISIISTSVVGAYGIIRGISIMAGGFPDERQVYELSSKGEWDQLSNILTGVVYAYLAGLIVLAILGMYVQFKYFYDGSKKKDEKKDDGLVKNENN